MKNRNITLVLIFNASSKASLSFSLLLWNLSASTDLTVLGMLLLFVCLYVAGLAACKRADVVATQSQRVHYLSDNSASDPYLYAVTTHTGLSSAARMSAKAGLFLVSYQLLWYLAVLKICSSWILMATVFVYFIFCCLSSHFPIVFHILFPAYRAGKADKL